MFRKIMKFLFFWGLWSLIFVLTSKLLGDNLIIISFIFSLVISWVIIYKNGLNVFKSSTQNFSSNSNEFEFSVDSSNEFKDDLNEGDIVKFWNNPNSKDEIRVYVRGTHLGDGLLSVFDNKRIYSLIKSNKENRDFRLLTVVKQIKPKSVIVELIKEDLNSVNQNELENYLITLNKKYNPKSTFPVSFVVQNRMSRKDNKHFKIEIDLKKDELNDFGTRIKNYEKSDRTSESDISHYEWVNSRVFLTYKEERISIENKTNSNNLSKLIRSKFSGYSIDDIKIAKTPDITSSEKYRMENKEFYPRPFIYSFDITPVKKDSN